MKKFIYSIGLFFILLGIASCSSDGAKTKEITPTSVEFPSGEIGKYVEFVDEP